jgi:hypothetical protein
MAELIRTLDQRADLLRGEGEVRWPEGVRFVPDTTGSAVFVTGSETQFVPRLGFAHIHSQPHAHTRTAAFHPGRARKFPIKPRRGTAGMPRESA